MWDDREEKENARRQMIGVMLILVFSFVFLTWFAPSGFRATPQAPPPTESSSAQDSGMPAAPPTTPEQTSAVSDGAWPGLPPVPAQDDPAADEVVLEDDNLRLVFTRIGGRLKQAYVLLGDHTVQLVPEPAAPGLPDTRTAYPLGLRFSDDALGQELNLRRWDVERDMAGRALTFTLTLPDNAVVSKRFALTDRPHVLESEVAYTNLENAPRMLGLDAVPAFTVYWGPNIASGDLTKGVKQTLIWRSAEQSKTETVADVVAEEGRFIAQPEWLGVKSAYFLVAFRPLFDEARGWASALPWNAPGPDAFMFGLAAPRARLASGETLSTAFELYLGPNELNSLDAAWPTLSSALRFFESFDIMDWFAKLLLRILNWFHDHTIANYGVAIILLTILVRVIMYPLTLKSMRSMKRMQMLAPEIEEVKKQYGEDPQELNKKIMELYRERGINPLGGCFPILLQMPVFIALYRMLWNAFELRGAPFMLWITDLSEPDRLMHIPALVGVPLLGALANVNVLPVLMGASMVLHQKVAPTSGPAQNPQQKAIMVFMPVFFSIICYNMAAGLNLYILTSTVLGMAQQMLIKPGEVKETDKKPAIRKKQHWYNAAQARKRQLRKQGKGK